MPRKPKVVGEKRRESIARKAKSEATFRMAGKLEPLSAAPMSEHKMLRRVVPEKDKNNLRKATSYASMIKRAIKETNDKKGVTLSSIQRYISANYDVKDNYKLYLKKAVTRHVEAGLLVKKSQLRYALPKAKTSTAKRGQKATKTEKSEINETKKRKTSGKKATKKVVPEEKTKKTPKKTTARAAKAVAPKARKGAAKGAKETRKGAKKTGRKTSSENSDGSSEKLVWMWQYYDNGFYNYDPAASDIVEGVYQEYLTSPFTCDVRSVQSGQWQYLIDFRQMTQQNTQHAAHKIRNIRRQQIPESERQNRSKRYEGVPHPTDADEDSV